MTEPSARDPLLSDRRRTVYITPDHLAHLIQLPEGAEIVRVQGSFDPVGIQVVVVHPEFSPVAPEAQAPHLYSYREYDPDTGRLTVTWRDPETEQAASEGSGE